MQDKQVDEPLGEKLQKQGEDDVREESIQPQKEIQRPKILQSEESAPLPGPNELKHEMSQRWCMEIYIHLKRCADLFDPQRQNNIYNRFEQLSGRVKQLERELDNTKAQAKAQIVQEKRRNQEMVRALENLKKNNELIEIQMKNLKQDNESLENQLETAKKIKNDSQIKEEFGQRLEKKLKNRRDKSYINQKQESVSEEELKLSNKNLQNKLKIVEQQKNEILSRYNFQKKKVEDLTHANHELQYKLQMKDQQLNQILKKNKLDRNFGDGTKLSK